MLINAVVYTFPIEATQQAAGLLTELASYSRREPGCHGFAVSRSNDDPRVFVLFEQWADHAALEQHYATDHFKRLALNGIRTLAESRLGHLCTPLIG
jgi:quinol monooxygenase YgiN